MAEELTIRRYDIDKVGAKMLTPVQPVKKLTDESNLNREMTDEINRSLTFSQDLKLYNNDYDACLVSEIRNITIIFENMVALKAENESLATENFNYVINLLLKSDMRCAETKLNTSVWSKVYFDFMREVYEEQIDEEEHKEMIQTKQESKRAAKDSVKNKWFKIGKLYSLKKFDLNGNIKDISVFRCVKFIYTVGINQINHVVMQKIGEPLHNDARTLSRLDCKMWHIKYSPDLYMFSMNQRFYPVGEKELEDLQKKQNSETKKTPIEQQNEIFEEIADAQKKRFTPEMVHNVEIKTIKG